MMFWILIIGLIGALVIAYGLVWFGLHRPRFVFAILLLLLPIHTGFFQIFKVESGLPPTLVTILQAWKEFFLILLLGWVFFKAVTSNKLQVIKPWLLLFILVFVSTGIYGMVKAPSLSAGVYSLRGTFEPFLVLALTLLLPLDIKWVKKLLPKLFIVGLVVSLFAIYQSLILGYPFLWKYYAQDGILPTSFSFAGGSIQRAMGTFASPNQLSLYLAFLIILATNLLIRQQGSKKALIFMGGLFTGVLILTVSRSGWLALITGLGISFILWRRKQKITLFALTLLVIAIVLGLVLGLDQWLIHSFTGKEASANYHADMLQQNIQTIAENPFGVGLGRVGARGVRFLSNDQKYYPTESYLMQTGLELGIPGLILFLSLIFMSAILTYRNIFLTTDRWSRALVVSAFAAIAAAFVHSILIPDLQDMAVSSYLWFLVGIAIRLPTMERQGHIPPCTISPLSS
jgi:hypothetical protein